MKAILSCVNELFSIKEKQALLQDNSKKMMSQLGEMDGEKRKIAEEIVRKVNELKEKCAMTVSSR